MRRLSAIVIGTAALTWAGAALAADPEPAATASATGRRWDYAALPILFYAPETSLGLAAGFTVFDDSPVPPDRPRRDDQVSVVFQGTLRKQYGVSVEGTKYWRDGRYKLEEAPVTLRFPNYFWGIGNDTPEDARDLYTMAVTQARTTFTTRIWEEIYLGEGVNLGYYRTDDVSAGNSVAQYLTTHPAAGVLFGGGPVLRRDTRDDAMGPHRGSFTSLSTTFYRKGLLSDFTYQIWEVDERVYVPLGKSVLGLQAYGRYAGGQPPLDEMSALGGGSRLRGYFEGRYRDRLYLMAQAEWRVRVWKRLSLAPFGAVGNVFPSFAAITADDPKVAGGVGVRVSLKQERDVNIRLDLAVSPISTGVYLNMGEAF
jgi:hypothetical protein